MEGFVNFNYMFIIFFYVNFEFFFNVFNVVLFFFMLVGNYIIFDFSKESI